MNISNIFNYVLEISIISSIIGIILITVRQILKGKVNSKWIYAIWFILLFKLLVPIKIESIVSIYGLIPENVTNNDYTSNVRYEEIEQNNDSTIANIDEEYSKTINENNNYEIHEAKKDLITTILQNNVVPVIWLIGVIVMLLWLLITNIIINLKLRKSYHIEDRLNNILKLCKNKMKIKRNINIIINDVVSTPALFGIFNVKILLPKEILKLSDENLEYIFIHELSHYKRKDICINYILLFIQSIHWFNPVIWLCFRLLRNDLELATDEYALDYINHTNYKSYANALIETLNVTKNVSITSSLIGMVDNKENIKRRIVMIKSLEVFKKKKVIITVICVALISILSICLLTIPKEKTVENNEVEENVSSTNNEAQNIIQDNSKKIAKLNTLDIKKSYIKDISENQIKNIEDIIKRGEEVIAKVSWHNAPDYVITFNDEIQKDINIRLSKDATISIEIETKGLYTIFAEEDVSYILNLLGEKNVYKDLPILDISKINRPLDVYWYGNQELKLLTYTWKLDNNSLINADSVLPKDVLKNEEALEWSIPQGTIITFYLRENGATKILPKETLIKYKIYSINDNGVSAEYKEATRMIDGSYYIDNLPRTKGEYILEVNMSFEKMINEANYCIKFKV